MDAVTMVANARGISEERVANDMTYRQLLHVVGVIVRDRMFVVTTMVHALGGAAKRATKRARGEDAAAGKKPSGGGQLPRWFKTGGKQVAAVVSTDGPLSHLRAVATGQAFPQVTGSPARGKGRRK